MPTLVGMDLPRAHQGGRLPGRAARVFHTTRGKRWELGVDKWVRALPYKRFQGWLFFVHIQDCFPHGTWRAMGTWCGQVGASVAAQAFRDVVKIYPPRAVPTKVGTYLAGTPWFSTPRVESGGGLVWTSG